MLWAVWRSGSVLGFWGDQQQVRFHQKIVIAHMCPFFQLEHRWLSGIHTTAVNEWHGSGFNSTVIVHIFRGKWPKLWKYSEEPGTRTLRRLLSLITPLEKCKLAFFGILQKLGRKVGMNYLFCANCCGERERTPTKKARMPFWGVKMGKSDKFQRTKAIFGQIQGGKTQI